MKINEYHKKRNEENIRKAKEQSKKTLSIEEVQSNSKESDRAESTRTTHSKDF